MLITILGVIVMIIVFGFALMWPVLFILCFWLSNKGKKTHEWRL